MSANHKVLWLIHAHIIDYQKTTYAASSIMEKVDSIE